MLDCNDVALHDCDESREMGKRPPSLPTTMRVRADCQTIHIAMENIFKAGQFLITMDSDLHN